GNFERVFFERRLPAFDIGLFGSHDHVSALGKCGGSRNRNRLSGASGNAVARKAVRGRETPRAIGENADAYADGFQLRERADRAVLRGEVALAEMHDPGVGVGSAAPAGGVERECGEVPHRKTILAGEQQDAVVEEKKKSRSLGRSTLRDDNLLQIKRKKEEAR